MDKILKCDFCDKVFKRENNYLKHKCEKMKRYDIFKTPVGHLAYLTFNQWRKISGHPPITVEVFTKSRYFNAFVKFAEFARSRAIPDKIGYIALMVEKQLLPFNWCDYEVYDYFIKTFDTEYSIDQKVDLSVETIVDIARKYECETAQIFENIQPLQVLKYITSRKLSPWLLLASNKFIEFMMYKTDKEQRMLFNQFVNVSEWKKYFMENPDKVTEIKNINQQLGI
jgi:phage FluMu protein Com